LKVFIFLGVLSLCQCEKRVILFSMIPKGGQNEFFKIWAGCFECNKFMG
jgi:hypothetical protein